MVRSGSRLRQRAPVPGLDRDRKCNQHAAVYDRRAAIVALAVGSSGLTVGSFRPVGSHSFGIERLPPEPFDQQPLEAAATISACLAAWRANGDPSWKAEAARAFAWFLGSNDLSVPLVDLETGSCRDGLHPDRANENRGAESAVCYLLSLGEMREFAAFDATGARTRLAVNA